jgi:hypothetical protein
VETHSPWLVEPDAGHTVWLGGVGVDFRIPGELTGGSVSIVEHPVSKASQRTRRPVGAIPQEIAFVRRQLALTDSRTNDRDFHAP